MEAPAVPSLIETDCADVYVPPGTEKAGAWTVLAAVVSTVIEYGGRESTVDEPKPLSVFSVVCTVSAVSLLSVMFAEVTCVICTVPVGAFGPEKVTGSAEVWFRLKT